MKTNKYLLFSKWNRIEEYNLDKLRAAIFNSNTGDFITKRIIDISCKERLVATGWFQCFKKNFIGSRMVVYDYFIEIDIEDLKDAQIIAIGAFFVGFLVGRGSKRYI